MFRHPTLALRQLIFLRYGYNATLASLSPPASQITGVDEPKGDRASLQGMLVRFLNVSGTDVTHVFEHAVETAVTCSPPPHSNIAAFACFFFLSPPSSATACVFLTWALRAFTMRWLEHVVVCVSMGKKTFGGCCHEKLFLLPHLAEAETFRHTSGGWRRLHQIQQCRLCAESECMRSSLPVKTKNHCRNQWFWYLLCYYLFWL